MESGRRGASLRQVHAVFVSGTVAGLDEGLLLERFVTRGDELAFEALVARFGPMVLGICRRMLDDPQDVEDAFQATFLVLVRKAATIGDGDLLGNWLYRVAKRVATRARLHARRRRSREVAGAEWAEMAPSRPDEGESRELQAVLDEELGRLPEKYRDPIVLCCLQGYTYEQAAERLKCPVGTVRSRLAGARKRLRARLVRRGVLVPAAALAADLAPSVARAAVPPALHAATVRAAVRVAAVGAVPAGAVSGSVATLTRGVMRSLLLIRMAWIAGLSLVLAAGGGVVAGPPSDRVDQLLAELARSGQRNTELEGLQTVLTMGLRAISERIPGLEANHGEPAKRVETGPARASGSGPEVARSARGIVGELPRHPPGPATPRTGLFVLDTATNLVKRIADVPDAGLTRCGCPSWSRDGTRVLFDATWEGDGPTRLIAITLSARGFGLASGSPGGNCPSLSPNGRDLAIMDNRGGCVTIMRTDGTARRRAGPHGRPSWSPDGRRILIAGITNPCPVWMTAPEGGGERAVRVEGQAIYTFPSWVDDATIVAVIGPDRAAAVALLDVSEPSQARVKEVLWKRGSDLEVTPGYPVYSADTNRLVFAGSDHRGMTGLYSLRRGQAGRLRRVNAVGESQELIALAGSPDGRHVLFSSDMAPTSSVPAVTLPKGAARVEARPAPAHLE